jgi:hypothetical protein
VVRGGGNGPSVGGRAEVCLYAPERCLSKLLSQSSVVRVAFRDASTSSESASRQLVGEFVDVEGAIVVEVGGRVERISRRVVNGGEKRAEGSRRGP